MLWRSDARKITLRCYGGAHLVVNDKLRPTKEYIWALKGLIRQCFWPGEAGIEITAAEQGLTIRQLRSRIEGRIAHLRRFDKRKAREVKALIYRRAA